MRTPTSQIAAAMSVAVVADRCIPIVGENEKNQQIIIVY
jgi:hypothetical protein